MGVQLFVVYEGGEEETIPIRPLGLVAAERQFGGGVSNGHAIEATLYAAWYQKGKPSGSFEQWLATIEDLVENRGEATRPLEGGPSPEPSPT